MNSREMYLQGELLAEQHDWPEGSPEKQYLLQLIALKEDARHSLSSHIKTLRHDLDRLEKMLRAESPILNTLGELQQRPAAVEARVGEFAAADKALRVFLKTFPAKVTTRMKE